MGLDRSEPSAADPPADQIAGELLDQTALAELRELAPDDFREVLELYLDEAPPELRGLAQILEQGDAPAAAAAAHRLKGESLAVGAARVAALVAELETRVRANDIVGATQLLAPLERALVNTGVALRAGLSGERHGAHTP